MPAMLTPVSPRIRPTVPTMPGLSAYVKNANGDVEHTFLTSIVDPHGILRVQYLGVRFDPEEFRRDLLSLLKQ